MSVSRRRLVPPVPEQLADQRQVFARHDGLAGGGVPKVVQAQSAELCIGADGAPASDEAVLPPALGVAGKQERIGVACTGKRVDMRPRGFTERHSARAGLGVRQIDGVAADVAPAQIEHFAAAASGEREQPERGDGLVLPGLAGVERAPEPG